MRKFITLVTLVALAVMLSNCIITARGTVPVAGKSSNHDRNDADVDVDLVVIPGTYVYWFDAGNGDVYFYRGTWWRVSGNAWYKASLHSGPWVTVSVSVVPQSVRNVPHNWKSRSNDAPHVHWFDTRYQWQKWEQDRHWEKKKWKR